MRTVLIVEDYWPSRDILKQLIEKEDRSVLTASDGHDGLQRARHIPPPSLILLDLSMPCMDGWEFLRQKNADPTIAAIPTIVVSGSLSKLPAGARDLLAKPLDAGRLLALVDQYC
jgi:CheY-like chemotaxis protein